MTSLPNSLLKLLLAAGIALVSAACSPTRLYYSTPPESSALIGVTGVYLDRFTGQNALLFREILRQEVHDDSYFEVVPDIPDAAIQSVVMVDGQVKLYSIRDEEERRRETQVLLAESRIKQQESSGNTVTKQAFEFVETPKQERLIHRTLDLELELTLRRPDGVLLDVQLEKVSFQQTYQGNEMILLIPGADDEMTRLGKLAFRRVLQRLRPVARNRTVELETGKHPAPWSLGFTETDHPQISQGVTYAANHENERAIKRWNYFLFEPQAYEKDTRFAFTDQAYVQIREAKLPSDVLKNLLRLYNQEFTQEQVDTALLRQISRRDFMMYGGIIKAHTRVSSSLEPQNLAAAHYNLGVLHEMRRELKLAAYHFAQANAYRPNEKYAQAWTDVQHAMGNYNPLDTMMERTIEAAGKAPPPEDAMVQAVRLEDRIAQATAVQAPKAEEEEFRLEPVELPLLDETTERTDIKPSDVKPLELD
jgi:tetratricopeptide (TPR) repeat protein